MDVALDQDEGTYRATAPAGIGTVAAPDGGSGAESYVIVRSAAAPHSSLDTAQVLPDAPYFGVIGSLGPDDSIDVYRMTLDPGTSVLQFELLAQQTPSSASVRFLLFDGTGRVLGNWSSTNDAGSSAIDLVLSGQLIGSTLYFGIAATNTSSPPGSSPSSDYQLWVSRLNATDRQSAGTGDASIDPSSSSPSPITGPIQPLATPPVTSQTPPTGGATAVGSQVSNGPGVVIVQVVGLMPTRMAGPLGGVLHTEDPTPSAVRQLAVTMNPEGVDRPSRGPGIDPVGASGRGSELGPEEAQGAMAALRGPGGFPLMGAGAIGSRRRAQVPIAAVSAVSASRNGGGIPEIDLLAAQGRSSPVSRAEQLEVDAASHPRTSGETRLPLSFSLSVAVVLTLNVVLCDPVAGFDFLASRLDLDLRELTRSRRSSPAPCE
jgi:hypothetical protein